MSQWDELKRQVMESQAWQSIFRHGYEDTPRNRILMVSGNVWLHLHPSKVRKHATRLRFTWCMGGITFLMFLLTLVTGVYLMFYYRRVADCAYAALSYHELCAHTLLRFYILHCIFIPLVASLFMAIHFWRIRRDVFSGPPL